MGIHGLWPLIKDKGYEPEVVYPSTRAKHLPNATSTVHVDLQACLFACLRNAYSSYPLATAHGIVERRLSQLIPKTNCIVYIDGLRCKEKQHTHASRDEVRKTALEETKDKIVVFAESVKQQQRVRKQTFVGIRKGLSKAFAWSTQAKESLKAFLEQKGWRVIMSRTESDLEIARQYTTGDVVATIDSDLLIYGNVERVWRPISGGRFLVYDVQEMVTALGINRVQLTALGIVSRNDYDCNIPSLGAATNFKIIKLLKAHGKLEPGCLVFSRLYLLQRLTM
jgi:hypothetical protein